MTLNAHALEAAVQAAQLHRQRLEAIEVGFVCMPHNIEHGLIAADKRRVVSASGAYANQASTVAESLTSETNRRRQSPPTVIANAIARAVTARRPETRYAVGFGARPMIFMHQVLPDRWFDAFMRRATGVPA